MRTRQRGFTLVEMMIAVAIVGVLSVLAVVGYRKLIGSSKVTEAVGILGQIRASEAAVKTETGKYVDVSSQLALDTAPGTFSSLYPHCAAGKSAPGNFKVAWGGTCSTAAGWSKLTVEVDAPVFYGYTVVSGSGTPPTVAVGGQDIAWPTTGGDYFVATAIGDVDGDGVYSMVVANSFDGEMRMDKEGE